MRVVKDTPLSLAWITFPIRPPATTLVVVAKATFDLRARGECELSEEQALVTGDMFWDDDVERAVRYDSDFAIAKPRGEWWLTGEWEPSRERAATHAIVEVGVGGQRKRLALIGDRWWKKGLMGGLTDPLPLGPLPLSYDRAFGGPKHKKNPHGLGMAPDPDDADGRIRVPNIEDPGHLIGGAGDRPAAAGLFPVSRMHPARMALTGTYRGDYMTTRWPYYPEDFRWEHFQAAPEAQRINGFYRGDEAIVAEGLHPDLPAIQCQLPGIEPRVFLHPAGAPAGSPLTQIAMVLDTIIVDATEAKAIAVWRGHVEGVQASLEDASHIFIVHEPRTEPGTIEGYRAWFDRKLAEEDQEDALFESAPIPEDLPAEEPAPEPPTEDDQSEEAEAYDPVAERRAQLIEEGVPLEVVDVLAPAPPAVPPTPEDPAVVAAREAQELNDAIAAARSLGQDDLADALEATRLEEEEPALPEEPPPVEAPPPTPREVVEQALAGGRSLAGLVAPATDLSGLDFSERDLSKAILVRCNLRECRFIGANLEGATLDEAVADGASFRGANLRGAHFDRLSGKGVSFRDANLEDAHANGAHLAGADFREAQAAHVELPRCFLADADFEKAVLDEAEFSGATLSRARFVDASLVDAWLDEGAVVDAANFEGANVEKLRAQESDLRDSSFKWAKGDGARFSRSMLDRANFSFADLAGSDFAEASCTQTIFLAIQAPEAVFDKAALVGAQLGRANLCEARFSEANLHHADLRGANLFRAEFYLARVEDALFELANLRGTKLEGK